MSSVVPEFSLTSLATPGEKEPVITKSLERSLGADSLNSKGHVPISEPIREVEDDDWSVLVMCSPLLLRDAVSSTQTPWTNNEEGIVVPEKTEMLLPANEHGH